MSTHSTHQKVEAQFAPVAANYATSAGHADQNVLAALVALTSPKPTDRVLDIATGAGNVALAFAPHVGSVVALDLTPAMLEVTAKRAQEAGFTNLTTVQGPAEELPFGDAEFDLSIVRLAPHHYADVQTAVREMARVTKPGGQVLIVDTISSEDDELDRQANEIEVLRDPSHVRNYRVSEWKAMVEAAGLSVVSVSTEPYLESGKAMEFEAWVQRIGTPAENIVRLREILKAASPSLRASLRITEEGERWYLTFEQMTLLAKSPSA